MRDYLLDLVEHTHDLGFIDLIKITGSNTDTIIDGISEDRSVVVQGKFITANPELNGVFGMPNLNKLKILLNLEEYKEEAKISLTHTNKDGVNVPSGIHFENVAGDFQNDYRFMVKEIVDDKLRTASFKGATWNVEFEPSIANIRRLKMMALANSEESLFQVKLENGNLKFYFGDHSTHAGDFVFQNNVAGTLANIWIYPVTQIIKILDLSGDKTIRLSDQGIAEIEVNSGLSIFKYLIPAKKK